MRCCAYQPLPAQDALWCWGDTESCRCSGFLTDAEVDVFTHKNRIMTYKIKICASMRRTVLCTYFSVLSDRSAVSTSSRWKGKQSSTEIKVFCVASLDISMRIAITPFSLFPASRKCCSSLGYQKEPKQSIFMWLTLKNEEMTPSFQR